MAYFPLCNFFSNSYIHHMYAKYLNFSVQDAPTSAH